MEMISPDLERTELGKIQIAPEVIEIIAGLATTEVEGVAHMSGGFVGDIAERLGRKNPTKGVKVEVGQKEAAVDVSVVIDFGYRIPDVASAIQNNVKTSIENMTGLRVVEVNVHIVDVRLKPEEKEPAEDTVRVR